MDDSYDQVKHFSYLEDLLTRPDGSQMSLKEANKAYGIRTIWVAALNSSVRDRSLRTRVTGYPPKIFLSYCWQDDEHKKWVRALADRLQKLGFEVLLDQYSSLNGQLMDAPEFVSSMVEANICLMVITPKYCSKTGVEDVDGIENPNEDGWVWDEHQWALRLSQAGMMDIIGLLKEGDYLPGGCGQHNTIDLRNVADPLAIVDQVFHYDGPVLDSSERDQFIQLLEHVEELVFGQQFEAAYHLLTAKPEFEDLVEYKMYEALIYAHAGYCENAVLLAREVLAAPRIELSAINWMAYALNLCGQTQEALQSLVKASRFKVPEASVSAQTHFQMGNVLDDLNSWPAAVNHMRYALTMAATTPALLNDLAMTYRHWRRYEHAEDCLRQAVAIEPLHPMAAPNLALILFELGKAGEAKQICETVLAHQPDNQAASQLLAAYEAGGLPEGTPSDETAGTGFTCTNCPSEYRIDLAGQCICGDCGGVHGVELIHCPNCNNDGRVPVNVLGIPGLPADVHIQCPVCHKGALKLTV